MSDSNFKFINFTKIFDYLTSRKFLINIGLMFLLSFLIIFGIFQWLKVYTNHGQRLLLENYLDLDIEEARANAETSSFQMIVNDSTHIVGKPGGIILNQNPKGGSYIKENRKIYVTITKYNPDMIKVKDLPKLYGLDYKMKSKELNSRQIRTFVKGTKYDKVSQSTILEVWNNGQLIINREMRKEDVEIEKGGTLEFIISEPEGGSYVVPDLTGMSLSAAELICRSKDFLIGEIIIEGEIKDEDKPNAIIQRQYPEADGVFSLSTGSKINVVIAPR